MQVAGMAAALALAPAAAGAVTWNIDFGGFETTFQAPAGGGTVSGLVAVLGGVTFDTPDPVDPPFYSVASNDFSAEDGSIFSYYLGTGGCPTAACVLEFENAIDDMTPPLWAAFPLEMGIPGTVFASGTYVISSAGPAPVPLPAPLALMAAGAVAIGLVGWRRKG
jgi:hypothetical protein